MLLQGKTQIIEEIEGRLQSSHGSKDINYYIDLSRSLGRSIYEVLCEVEKVLSYTEIAEIFSRYSGVEVADTVEGEVVKCTSHYIETDHAVYVWHYVSVDMVNSTANGKKKVFLIPKDVFDSYALIDHIIKVDSVSLSSTREWFMQHAIIPAVKANATDIHIVPRPDAGTYKIYFRVLGDLVDVLSVNEKYGRAIIHLLLYWAKEFTPSIRIDDFRRPQDGRVEIPREQVGIPLDIRLSFIPKSNISDMDVVARMLYKIELQNETLHGLGFSPSHEKLLLDITMKNRGIVLATGATGTGKSRTINTILSKIHTSRNVLTVEDPVEYLLSGARQFQVFEWESADGKRSRVDFDAFARAFKRHDPDVIFIGELRDKTTADTAFHLSKTGHLVFATLHASRASIVPEMLHHDYGISIDEIADNLLLATNQVLVKRICPDCSTWTVIDSFPEWFKYLGIYHGSDAIIERLAGKKVRSIAPRKGCPRCSVRYDSTTLSTGYIGRTVIAECIAFEPAMFEDKNISAAAMDRKTASCGNMLSDAVDKLIAGMIDIEALKRLL